MPTPVLLPYQQAWINDKSKVKICEKSRRIGLSYADALDSAMVASLARGSQNTNYISYNKEMTRQYIQDCADWAKRLSIAASELEEVILDDEDAITIYRIRFATGREIVGLPSNARALRSKKGRVRIDEAAFIDDFEEVLTAALALTMWGGDVGIISTHAGDDNPFNLLINDVHAGRLPYSLHRYDFDTALSEGLYRKICEVSDQEWSQAAEDQWREETYQRYGERADQELRCFPTKSGGAYLTQSTIEACMRADIPVLRLTAPDGFVDWPLAAAEEYIADWLQREVAPHIKQIPRSLRSFIGGDFARSGDLTSFFPLVEQQNLELHAPFIIELRDMPFRSQEQILGYIGNHLPNMSGMALDARGNGQALAEWARQEFGHSRVLEVMTTESWYREAMPRLKAHLDDRTMTIPQDKDVLADLRSLRLVRGVARVPEQRAGSSDDGKRHGDSAIAAAMAIWARHQLGQFEPWDGGASSGPPASSCLLQGWW